MTTTAEATHSGIAAGASPSAFAAPFRVVHPETGVTLLEVGLGQAGPNLRLFDYEGKPRIYLDADPFQGSAVEVCAPDGRALASLGDGGAFGGMVAVDLPDPDDPERGGARALLMANDTDATQGPGKAALEFQSAGGEAGGKEKKVEVIAAIAALEKRIAELEANRSRVPAPFRVIDPATGEHCFEVFVEKDDGAPTFCLCDRAGNLVIAGGQGVDGAPFLSVFRYQDQDRLAAVELRVDEEGGRVEFRQPTGAQPGPKAEG